MAHYNDGVSDLVIHLPVDVTQLPDLVIHLPVDVTQLPDLVILLPVDVTQFTAFVNFKEFSLK